MAGCSINVQVGVRVARWNSPQRGQSSKEVRGCFVSCSGFLAQTDFLGCFLCSSLMGSPRASTCRMSFPSCWIYSAALSLAACLCHLYASSPVPQIPLASLSLLRESSFQLPPGYWCSYNRWLKPISTEEFKNGFFKEPALCWVRLTLNCSCVCMLLRLKKKTIWT